MMVKSRQGQKRPLIRASTGEFTFCPLVPLFPFCPDAPYTHGKPNTACDDGERGSHMTPPQNPLTDPQPHLLSICSCFTFGPLNTEGHTSEATARAINRSVNTNESWRWRILRCVPTSGPCRPFGPGRPGTPASPAAPRGPCGKTE